MKKIKLIKEKKAEFAELPSTIREKFYKMMGCAVLSTLLLTLLMCVLSAFTIRGLLVTFFIAIGFFGIAIWYRYSVTHKEILEIKGTVVYVKKIISATIKNRGQRVLYYHVQTDSNKMIMIPAEKNQTEIHENGRIKIYIPSDAPCTKSGGVLKFSSILGYDLLPTISDEE